MIIMLSREDIEHLTKHVDSHGYLVEQHRHYVLFCKAEYKLPVVEIAAERVF